MRTTDLPVFKALARGLNVAEKRWLEQHLSEAKRHLLANGEIFDEDKNNLDLCFTWHSTPQGHDFWSRICSAHRLRAQHGN